MLFVGAGSQLWSLLRPAGRDAALHHIRYLAGTMRSFNVLGEITQIQHTTRQLVTVNQHVIATLQAMNQEALNNARILQQLQRAQNHLAGQNGLLSRLDVLTARQIPLSRWLATHTGTLQQLMNEVRLDSETQDQRVAQMNQLTAAIAQEIAQIVRLNQEMAQGPLNQAVTITNQMAGR